jgi:hypothetical protein
MGHLDAMGETNISPFCWKSNRDSSVALPVASHYTNWAIPAVIQSQINPVKIFPSYLFRTPFNNNNNNNIIIIIIIISTLGLLGRDTWNVRKGWEKYKIVRKEWGQLGDEGIARRQYCIHLTHEVQVSKLSPETWELNGEHAETWRTPQAGTSWWINTSAVW